MKAPAFWYGPDCFQARLLAPLGLVYRAAGLLRRAVATPYRASVPVICIGNVVAGGAGKTPTALALADLLKRQGANPAFVSRGYGGTEAGPLRVDLSHHTAEQVGDEALLLAVKAPCWIGHDRAAAVRAAEPHASHIILDDGLQNPSVAPSLSLLVIDGETGLGNGRLIPAGPLRETLADALGRVDAIVLIGEDQQGIKSLIQGQKDQNGASSPPLLSQGQAPAGIQRDPGLDPGEHMTHTARRRGPLDSRFRGNDTVLLLHASLQPRLPDDFPRRRDYFAFAGIGRPEKFYASCRLAGLNIVSTLDFPDHHPFSAKELADLAEHARVRKEKLITTAKDWARLPADFRTQVEVLPVELVFEDEAALMGLMSAVR